MNRRPVPNYAPTHRLTAAEVVRRRREAHAREVAESGIGRWMRVLVAVFLVGALAAGAAVATNTMGAGDRFERLIKRVELVLNPPPDRPTVATVDVTPEPSPTPAPSESVPPGDPTPTPTPQPPRKAVDFKLALSPTKYFASQSNKEWCAVAGVQMVLAMHGQANTSVSFQQSLAARINEWESYKDSHNGDWGPAAMVEALDAYGVPGYVIHAHKTRDAALRDAAVAMEKTNAPVIIIAWRGAHTWVMNGFRATADPSVFADAVVTGTYIMDPWYPRISSIWGPSDPPGTFQNTAEMVRNFLPWKRPEGKYPDRDGKFLVVVPTVPLA
jgi:hypothetical protein